MSLCVEPLFIRLAAPIDFDRIVDIERHYFEQTVTRDDLEAFAASRTLWTVVAETRGRVDGFCIYEVEEKAVDVIQLCVDRGVFLQGIGSALLNHVKRLTLSLAKTKTKVLTSEANIPAQLFLRRGGFACEAVLRDFFPDEPEGPRDAYLFTYRNPAFPSGGP